MNEKQKAPAFQFYPADYLQSLRVQMMTLEEEGAYIRLMSYCWKNESIPSDLELLARLVGKGASTTLLSNIVPMFNQDPKDPTKLRHERLDKEREKQRLWREKSSEGGKKSADFRASQKRESKGASTTVDTNAQPKVNSSSSSSSIHTPTPLMHRAANLFNRRESTEWSPKEILKWKKNSGPILGTSEEEWELLEWAYAQKSGDAKDYRRRELVTLIENWNGEITKARSWKQTNVPSWATDEEQYASAEKEQKIHEQRKAMQSL